MKKFHTMVWVLLAVLVMGRIASAQNVGTIAGTVKDAQGLTVPGASITIENRISHVTQSTDTDLQGQYTLSNVAFGTYVLTVALQGFTPAQQVVEVRSSVAIERNVQLTLGALSETVNVSADALLETSAVGSHVDIGSTLIDRMPSATPSKQLSAMLLSAPGFIPSQNGRVHVRGSHGQIQYVVDGVPMTDEYSEAFANPLDPRYVKSAEVMTGGIPAEYGGKLAAVVDITSKSGLDDPSKATGNASFNVGAFGAVDGSVTVGGRVNPRLGYFLSGSANRTDRYLDPPTTDNFHNSGSAERFTGKIEFRPSDADFVRAVMSMSGSRFDVANRPDSQARGVATNQDLNDNSQTLTWLRQFGDRVTLDTVAYRRAARAKLDASTAWPLAATQDRQLNHQGINSALSYSATGHRFKAGIQYDRFPLVDEDGEDFAAVLHDVVVAGELGAAELGLERLVDGRDVGLFGAFPGGAGAFALLVVHQDDFAVTAHDNRGALGVHDDVAVLDGHRAVMAGFHAGLFRAALGGDRERRHAEVVGDVDGAGLNECERRLVGARGGDGLSVRRESERVHDVGVALQFRLHLPVGGVPHARGLVLTGCGDQFGIGRAERDRVHRRGVPGECLLLLESAVGADLPELHHVVEPGGGECLAVRRHRDRMHQRTVRLAGRRLRDRRREHGGDTDEEESEASADHVGRVLRGSVGLVILRRRPCRDNHQSGSS